MDTQEQALKDSIIAEAEQHLREVCAPFKCRALRMRYLSPERLDLEQERGAQPTSAWRPDAPQERDGD